jgi:hypothetical protein
MPFPPPAASRPKVPLLAALCAAACLCVALPASAAGPLDGSQPAFRPGNPLDDSQPYRTAVLPDALVQDRSVLRTWGKGSYRLSISRETMAPGLFSGGARDQALRVSVTIKW